MKYVSIDIETTGLVMKNMPIFGKRCTSCGRFRFLTFFSKSSETKDGYYSMCKACLVGIPNCEDVGCPGTCGE